MKRIMRFKALLGVAAAVLVVSVSLGAIAGCAPRDASQVNEDSGTVVPEGTATAVGVGESQLEAAKAAYSITKKEEAGTCGSCHVSADQLEASKSSEEVDASMYQVDEAFAKTLHGSLGCVKCHGGDNAAGQASAAHAGMTVYPTADGGAAACGSCHTDIVDRAATSLHYTTAGIECSFEGRLSQAGENGEGIGEVYYRTEGCPDCHADCGQCHVRNAAQNNFGVEYTGLIDGHMFIDATDNEDIQQTCLSCHAGSITGCFTQTDVHGAAGANLNCMDCHTEAEVHGDGVEYDTMIHSGAVTTECTECHASELLSGQWHSDQHLDEATCWACHNVEYNTCTSCHGWDAASRGDEPFTAENDMLLGYSHGKITTLVKGPVDAGMLADVGVDLDPDSLNTQSSYYSGFAHGIVKPVVDQVFCDRCHGEGTGLLKEEDLQYPDFETELLVGSLPEVTAEAAKSSQ